jgi:hypothetical protein
MKIQPTVNKTTTVLRKIGFKVDEQRTPLMNTTALTLSYENNPVGTVEMLFHGGRKSPVFTFKEMKEWQQWQRIYRTKNFTEFGNAMQEYMTKQVKVNSSYFWNLVNYFWN